MRKAYLLSLILVIPYFMDAQTDTLSAAGEYYLRGVMETASGFKLNTDGTFQFFFSYGALDRYGGGKWTLKGNHIVLNSETKHLRDFALMHSKKQDGDNITIKIVESNTHLFRYIYGTIAGGEKKQQGAASNDGQIIFTSQNIDSLILVFEFCPEKQSVFTIPANGNDYFEFRIEPWIMEVYFENFDLQITDDGLEGNHPLLAENKKYNYEKARR